MSIHACSALKALDLPKSIQSLLSQPQKKQRLPSTSPLRKLLEKRSSSSLIPKDKRAKTSLGTIKATRLSSQNKDHLLDMDRTQKIQLS